jgi:hypothetical protein
MHLPLISSALDRLVGGAEQLVNELAAVVPVPIGPWPRVPIGDVFEPHGDDQRAGADVVERWFHGPSEANAGSQRTRAARPLLAALPVVIDASGSARVEFRADAPGADWSDPDRACGMVALYVDGHYHSTVVVPNERTTPYAVSLGDLEPGTHHVELRAAIDATRVRPRVGDVRTTRVSGQQALVERHAPILELRRDGDELAAARGNDAQLMVVPAMTRRDDGGTTIEYRLVSTSEDGGTTTGDLYAQYGRGMDTDPIYRVELDPSGTVEREEYQATLHAWTTFDGERAFGRPLLRISTTNNLVSARTHGDAPVERWGEAPVAPIAGSATELAALAARPWTWQLTGKELLRERASIDDPRAWVYLGALDGARLAALAAAGGADVRLADGRVVRASTLPGAAQAEFGETALALPDGVTGSQVAAVGIDGVRAIVLDDQLRPRDVGARA